MQPIFMEGKIAIFDFSDGNTSRELCESITELMDKGYTVKLKKVTSGETDDTVQYYTAQTYSVNKSTSAITVSFDGGTLSESEWTEGGSGGGNEQFEVIFTYNTDTEEWECNKTFNEIKTALINGTELLAKSYEILYSENTTVGYGQRNLSIAAYNITQSTVIFLGLYSPSQICTYIVTEQNSISFNIGPIGD